MRLRKRDLEVELGTYKGEIRCLGIQTTMTLSI